MKRLAFNQAPDGCLLRYGFFESVKLNGIALCAVRDLRTENAVIYTPSSDRQLAHSLPPSLDIVTVLADPLPAPLLLRLQDASAVFHGSQTLRRCTELNEAVRASLLHWADAAPATKPSHRRDCYAEAESHLRAALEALPDDATEDRVRINQTLGDIRHSGVRPSDPFWSTLANALKARGFRADAIADEFVEFWVSTGYWHVRNDRERGLYLEFRLEADETNDVKLELWLRETVQRAAASDIADHIAGFLMPVQRPVPTDPVDPDATNDAVLLGWSIGVRLAVDTDLIDAVASSATVLARHGNPEGADWVQVCQDVAEHLVNHRLPITDADMKSFAT